MVKFLMKAILIRIAFPFAMICTCFVMATAQLHEQEKQDTEETLQEFFLNETVFVQNKNEFQVTTKPAYWNQKDRQEINLPFQFEYGITNRLQIGL